MTTHFTLVILALLGVWSLLTVAACIAAYLFGHAKGEVVGVNWCREQLVGKIGGIVP